MTVSCPPPPTKPPVAPPDFDGRDRPPDEGECPACRFPKAGECLCGYNWDTFEWVNRAKPAPPTSCPMPERDRFAVLKAAELKASGHVATGPRRWPNPNYGRGPRD